jgi:hypothetical protein
MKKTIALIGILSASAVAASSQNQSNQQNQTCRDISAGGYIAPDEVIMQTQSGYVACRVFKLLPGGAKNETAPPPAAAPNPAPAPPPARAPAAWVLGGAPLTKHAPHLQAAFGYQYDSVNLSGSGYSSARANTNGAFVQVIGNLSANLSVIGNVDAIYRNIPIITVDSSGNTGRVSGHDYLLTYTGGVQAYPMGHRNWMPFVRSTFGVSKIHLLWPYQYSCGATAYCVGGAGFDATGFAWQIGGGVDYRLRRESRLAVRLGQFDYGQMKKYGVNVNSFKLGGGLTF